MKPLSDRALERLREAATLPDLTGTRYELIRELGRGGMGVVYLADDRDLGRQVALKVLHLDDASAELAARMRREAQTLAHLEHPNIVPVYDFGVAGGRLFYVMKYVRGKRLDEYAGESHSLPDRLRLFVKLCEAAAYAHSRGILHRDLKPENVMVGPFGEVLIMDWGLAKVLSEAEPEGRVMGTAAFMPPEQSRGEALDQRADVFALGRILAWLTRSTASKPLGSIASKAQAAVAGDRYADAASLAEDVLRLLDGLPVSAYNDAWYETLSRYWSRNRTLLLLVLTYVVIRFLIFFWTRR